MKKLLSVVFSALLVLGLFAGCTGTKDTETTKAPETNPPVQSQEALTQAPPSQEQTQTPGITPEAESTVPVQSPASSPSDVSITADEAKTIALNHAGFTAGDIRNYRSELDRENGRLVYEIEFDSGNYEYDYEVDATSGAVLKAEKDFED